MRKIVTIVVIFALAGLAYGDDWIKFPVASMGPNETQTFDITGNLDAESALGMQVVDIRLTPMGTVSGTLTISVMTTMGSTFELAEGANWMDFSDAPTGFLSGMTLDWTVASVSGPLTAGFVTLVSSPGASGTWGLLVGDGSSDGYLDVEGAVFGTVYDGEITVGGVVPEPVTLSLLALGGLGVLLREKRR